LPILGPVPNEAITPNECDTYGGSDPNLPDNGFYTCNNHGDWNPGSFSCDCDLEW